MPTIKQSRHFAGQTLPAVASPQKTGETMTYIGTHTFNESVLTGEILELFPVFPHGKVVDMEIITENVGAVLVDVGFMTGDCGSTATTRTLGTEFITATSAATTLKPALAKIIAAASKVGGVPVSIGVKSTAADITASATKKLHYKITVLS